MADEAPQSAPCHDEPAVDFRPDLPVVDVSFYYGQDRLGFVWCDLHDVLIGSSDCRCKP